MRVDKSGEGNSFSSRLRYFGILEYWSVGALAKDLDLFFNTPILQNKDFEEYNLGRYQWIYTRRMN
jgi:hypothetical protein